MLERAPRRQEIIPSAVVVAGRLRELQTLCGKDEALLFVAGIDGKYNKGSGKALNYLFFGHSGYDIQQALHEDFEDHIVGPIANLQVLGTSEQETSDMDLSEERKVLHFLEMVKGFKSYGVELSTDLPSVGKAELENWPLIQVYGVEELGNR